MGLKDRLLEFIEYKGLNRAAFEKSCGLSNGYTRNIKDNLGTKKLEDILRVYPDLNRVWLLTGEGPMLKDSDEVQQMATPASNAPLPDAPPRIEISPAVSNLLEKTMEEIAALRRLAEKAQLQLDELIKLVKKEMDADEQQSSISD